ncbi:MAG: rod shape-determining protein MreC [Gammaproteobacteria bacterium]|nr:rod shape-determining protein MreC [Gammaproteobacteria bacterium]
MRPLFQKNTALNLRLFFFMALSAAAMLTDHRHQHLQEVRNSLSQALYPLQYLVNLPSRLANWSSEIFSSHGQLLQENQRLKQQQLLLQARLQKLEIIDSENARLRELLHASFKVGENVLVAEMLAVDMDPYRQQVVINKGSNDDAYEGQPLIDAHGIIGQIIHAYPYSSEALLLTDLSHSIPAQLNRNGLRTIVSGTGKTNQLELLYISNSADIRIGDRIISSGLGRIFPANYPIGVVSSVKHYPGRDFVEAYATPSAHVGRSREVLLVWDKAKLAADTQATEAAKARP